MSSFAEWIFDLNLFCRLVLPSPLFQTSSWCWPFFRSELPFGFAAVWFCDLAVSSRLVLWHWLMFRTGFCDLDLCFWLVLWHWTLIQTSFHDLDLCLRLVLWHWPLFQTGLVMLTYVSAWRVTVSCPCLVSMRGFSFRGRMPRLTSLSSCHRRTRYDQQPNPHQVC